MLLRLLRCRCDVIVGLCVVCVSSFAADEGFDSVLSCFTEINELVVQDKADRVRMLRELAHRMQDMQEAWQQKLLEGGDSGHGHREGHGHAGGDSKADSKDAGESKAVGGRVRDSKGAEEEEEAKADSKQQQEQEREAPPVVMFFQPVPMEDLLGYVLSMTEYTTFSVIMRTKVKQAKLLTIMTRRVQAQGEAGRARARLMQDGGSGALEEVYCELVRRVCGLAPQQAELQHELRAELAEEDWGDMLASVDRDGGEFSAKYKAVFKRLVMCVCMSIWQSIVSQEAQQRVRLQLCRFLPQIDQLEGAEEVRVAAAGFLDIGHALLDETEQGVVQVLQAHSRHHRQRRLEEEEEESGGRGEAK